MCNPAWNHVNNCACLRGNGILYKLIVSPSLASLFNWVLLLSVSCGSAQARVTDISNGCVSCHYVAADGTVDYRLSVKLLSWARDGVPEDVMVFARRAAEPGTRLLGRHPDVSAQLKSGTIPDLCIDCHRSRPAQAPDFGRLLHLLKYTRHKPGVGNHFKSVYGGRCSHCHELDAKTGVMRIKSGSEKPLPAGSGVRNPVP